MNGRCWLLPRSCMRLPRLPLFGRGLSLHPSLAAVIAYMASTVVNR